MKTRLFLARLVLALAALSSAAVVRAQDATADLKSLVDQIETKLKAGKRSAEDLAPELAAFDALEAKYRGQKTDEAARIAYMRATLYLQVLKDQAKGRDLLSRIATDFPGTQIATTIERILAKETAQTEIVGKAAPELHFKWASSDGLKQLSDLKGKVVVLDFWATWCGPCIASFPQVRELVEHYKGADVAIVGVTSIQGRVVNLEAKPIDTKGDPTKEMSLMPAFMKAKDMTWTVAFSEEEVFNPAYGIEGIPHMTIIAPDGTVRHNDLHPAMPHAEKTEKIDAILKEFGRKIPATAKL